MHFQNIQIFRTPPLQAALVVIMLLTGSCSTQKDSFVNRAYHTINAKYNGFFNARESYRDGVGQLAELHNDNYEQILSIFRYGTEQDAGSVSSNMDVAYEKASLVIRRHSMNIRGKEHNRYIDESYFLIGRSHFFKRDYTLAILTFEYIIRQYDTHRSHDAKVWIAKSYNEQERYEQALRMFNMLEQHYRNGILTDETTALFRKAYADYYIRQGKYPEAARQLQMGIPYEKSRSERVRLTFIQAQLYHHSEKFAEAQQAFEKVLSMRPDRNMAFQASIGMAMAYDPSVGGSGFIRDELMDMLSAERNREYRDQIYYALAQLALRQGDEKEAISMLRKSAEVSQTNDMQKGLSFLRLGEIFFEHPDYKTANQYYDSAATFLPHSYDDYELVRRRQQMLSNLTQLSRVIAHEDSLQTLAALPAAEQEAIVEAIIEDLREQQRLREEAERQRQAAMRDAAQRARQTRGMSDHDRGWYFYNTTAMDNGKNEFFGRFGERPLEDLWRISNKQMIAGDFGMDMPGFEDMEHEEDTLVFDEFDKEKYLRNIPNTEEQLLVSKNRQVEAYFNKGMLFKDQLNDPANAIRCFETLVEYFPKTDRELPAYYHLYFMLREQGDAAAAERVKNSLVQLYPDSEYARIIGDPGYADRIRERQTLADNLYRESYNAFFAGRYDVIGRNMEALDTLEVSRELKARFAYLHAIATAKTERHAIFVSELQRVVDEFHDTPVHQPASTLLASLDAGDSMIASSGSDEVRPPSESNVQRERAPISSPFTFSPDAAHFFVLIVNDNHHDPRDLNNIVNNFNKEVYADTELAVSNIYFEGSKHLVTVTNFKGKETGMQYYRTIMQSENLSELDPDGNTIEYYVISVDNYPLFYQEKELDAYRHFFEHYYLDI